MELLQECPVCQQRTIEFTEKIRDHFLSQEDFQIFRCLSCGHLFTNPRPELAKIAAYYKSDEYISHSNSSKGLINKIYKIVRGVTLKWKAAQLNQAVAGKGNLLDIGCGTGSFLAHMQAQGWRCTGIEPDPDARALAASKEGIEIFDENHLSALPDASFDAITLWHVLEHVYDLNQRMDEINRLLKPGGTLILALPNPDSADARRYGPLWAAWDVPRHVHHFRPSVVHQLLNNKGFRFITSKGMVFDAYYISMLSEKYRKSNLIPLRGFINGFLSNGYASRHKETHSSMMYLFAKN